MKKFLSIIALCLMTVMLVSAFASCSDNKQFVGTWEEIDEDGNTTGETLVLASDGSGSVTSSGMSGSATWDVDGDKVFITVSICGMTESQEFTYEFSDDTMTLTDDDGEKTVYRLKD